ncbi:MAG: hypothetical protein A2Y86_05245 [Candidatus Aminicenantes bacterium RBG_13_62_12]|nr:MAG: hypothetical protein A2Y86_05245 [Candidatus Aminicenantes bacterium RBG_13_62_12]
MAEQRKDELAPEKRQLALAADFGEVYTVVREGQLMEPVRGRITLFQALGHLYEMKKGSADWRITAMGYRYLNKVASVSLVSPQSVIVDGAEVPNPHIERNKRTKAIESVNLRRMGIGFSPIGAIVVIDKTLFYNVYTYFIQSVQAKMARAAGCAEYGIAGKAPDKPGSWAWYATEPPLGIWIDYQNDAILDCLQEHTQRQRFGDRMATTILDRNILKDHPAIAAAQVHVKAGEGGIKATVVVYGYRNTQTPRNISEIMKQAEAQTEAKDFEHREEMIVEVAPEDEKQALEETAVEDAVAGAEKIPDEGAGKP